MSLLKKEAHEDGYGNCELRCAFFEDSHWQIVGARCFADD